MGSEGVAVAEVAEAEGVAVRRGAGAGCSSGELREREPCVQVALVAAAIMNPME